MKLLSIVLYIFSFISLVIASYSSSKIIQANDQNFQKLIKTPGKFSFVDFYADWCRHCKKLSPTIDELSNIFQDYPQIQILKINGDKDGKKLSKKYVEIGYPTLLFFDDSGKYTEFQGSRDLESFSNFIQQLSGIRLNKDIDEQIDKPIDVVDNDGKIQPISSKDGDVNIEDEDNKIIQLTSKSFKKAIETNQNLVVLFSSEYCNACQNFEHLYKKLSSETFGKDYPNLKFAEIIVDDEESQKIISHYQIKNLPSVLFFKNHDLQKPIIYNGDVRRYDKLMNSINLYYGLSRDINGDLTKDAGILPEINELISGNLNNKNFEQIYLKIDEVDDSIVDFYKSILESLQFKNFKFLNLEFNRIQFILNEDYDKLDGVTLDILKKKLNVLNSLKL
ncbi:tigA [Candida jiufengensis]|uniref:tigA n=1 Tax=Candida jiufengensis TaxID=497108 RepID=UPI002224AEC1|nr:tigA [Candida jiufengensis]KAI5953257.1 tigA [Candida jiufengensis]